MVVEDSPYPGVQTRVAAGPSPADRPSKLPALEGRDAFRQACSRCHALPDLDAHRPGEWPGVVLRRRDQVGRSEGMEDLTDEEAGEVVRYLKRAAAWTPDSTTVR